MSITEDITAFFARVSDTQTTIEAITDPFFKRALLLSLLDTLARCAYPNTRKNRDRFVGLIDAYSQWSDRDRYSLRQLHFCLKDIQDPSKYPTLPNLLLEVQARLQRWPAELQLLFPKDVDPTRQELQSFIVGDIGRVIEKVRYPSLVWVIRNYAVHELSHPGGGMDFDIGRPDPYYHHLTQAETGQGSWELFFPVECISKLVADSATNLRLHLLQNKVNPWNSFVRKADWYTGV